MLVNLDDIRFQREVEALHGLGARVHFEFLRELGEERMLRSVLEQKVRRYIRRLDPRLLAALGADRFPPLPLHVVALKP